MLLLKSLSLFPGMIEPNDVIEKMKNLFESISDFKGKDKIPTKEFQKNPEVKIIL